MLSVPRIGSKELSILKTPVVNMGKWTAAFEECYRKRCRTSGPQWRFGPLSVLHHWSAPRRRSVAIGATPAGHGRGARGTSVRLQTRGGRTVNSISVTRLSHVAIFNRNQRMWRAEEWQHPPHPPPKVVQQREVTRPAIASLAHSFLTENPY